MPSGTGAAVRDASALEGLHRAVVLRELCTQRVLVQSIDAGDLRRRGQQVRGKLAIHTRLDDCGDVIRLHSSALERTDHGRQAHRVATRLDALPSEPGLEPRSVCKSAGVARENRFQSRLARVEPASLVDLTEAHEFILGQTRRCAGLQQRVPSGQQASKRHVRVRPAQGLGKGRR